jgi:hypothetical protein
MRQETVGKVVALVLLLAACADGKDGNQGAAGANGPAGTAGGSGPAGPQGPGGGQGTQGPAGPAGNAPEAGVSTPRVVWKDANGAEVTILSLGGYPAGSGILILDSRGYIWGYGVGSSVASRPNTLTMGRAYAGTDCTGTEYTSATLLLGRTTFVLEGQTDPIRAMPDSVPSATVTVHSFFDPSCSGFPLPSNCASVSCRTTTSTDLFIETSATIVTPPLVPPTIAHPMHPERAF